MVVHSFAFNLNLELPGLCISTASKWENFRKYLAQETNMATYLGKLKVKFFKTFLDLSTIKKLNYLSPRRVEYFASD